MEIILPKATSNSFWLKGARWQFPTYSNVETFIDWLVRAEVLVRDPIIHTVVHDLPQVIPARTVRHHFLRTTGLTQSHIRQVERAQQAAALLQHGVSIPDVVYQLGYFDQPHLTRSLKRFIGKTPTQYSALRHTPA